MLWARVARLVLVVAVVSTTTTTTTSWGMFPHQVRRTFRRVRRKFRIDRSLECPSERASEQAQNVLDVTDSDVFMLGAHFPQKLGRDPTHMVIIGRARVSKLWGAPFAAREKGM